MKAAICSFVEGGRGSPLLKGVNAPGLGCGNYK
jgi:hypothetical protein